MARLKFPALTLAAVLAISPVNVQAGVMMPPPIIHSSGSGAAALGLIGCVSGIMLAAIDAGRRFNRELRTEEAASCGLLYWINLANRR